MEDKEGRVETLTTIREARVTDLQAIARIEAESYSNPWQPDTFRSLLERHGARILVAVDPTAGVVGFAVLWWVLDQGELANLAVKPELRGRGIGGSLLDRALAEARGVGVCTIFLEVRVSNDAAHRLYDSRGFTRISTRPEYYQNPREDAWVLARSLESAASGAPPGGGESRPSVPGRPEG